MNYAKSIIPLSALVIGIALAWFLRPLFHGYILSIWTEPLGTLLLTAGFVALIIGGALSGKAYVRTKLGRPKRVNVFNYTIPLTLGILLLSAAAFYKGAAADIRLASAYKSYTFEDTSSLPADQQSRLVPLPVAERFGADSLQRSTERAYNWNPQLWDGNFSWVTALTPNSPFRQWFDQARGVQVVDATTTQRRSQTTDQAFTFSEGVQLTDNIRWKLYKQRYLIDLPEIYYAKVNDAVYAVAPIVSYRGWFIRYPVVDGAFVVAADGSIEQLGLEEAKNHPAVRAAGRLYPESYVRFVHESYALKNGVLNKWFRHVDQTEISDPAGESNSQPYMLSTKDGLAWVSAADPWGKSFGIYKIFITNAITGRHQLYSVAQDAALTGAAQAIGYIKSARPQYNWRVDGSQDTSSSGNIIAIEPRPLFVDSQLYWMVAITTTEAKGINETCFVHAKDNQVTCAVNDEEIKSFIATAAVKPAQSTATPNTPGTDNAATKATIDKLEATLRQALKELEELKASQK